MFWIATFDIVERFNEKIKYIINNIMRREENNTIQIELY